MPRRVKFDSAGVDALLLQQERLARHQQFTQLGVPISTVTFRIRPNGPWQRLLPGVVLSHRGTPTRRERLLGALLFCGEGTVVTGLAALDLRGVRAARGFSDVHVLIPEPRQRSSFGYVVVQRCRTMPQAQRVDAVPLAPVARAVVDAVRLMAKRDSVRELVAEVVQRCMCTVAELQVELQRAARQRSALGRSVLGEIASGVRSVAEVRAREVLREGGVPEPLWNVHLRSQSGELIAVPDGYWETVAAAIQIDSMRWHLGPQQYQRTQERQRRLTTNGVLVLPVAPDHIISRPQEFVREVKALLAAAAARPRPSGLHVGSATTD